MNEFLIHALEELKRVEHLIYVSLKYTRTVDVIKSIIVRLIDAYDFVFNGLLEKLKDEKKVEEIPTAPRLKCEIIKEQFPDEKKLHSYIDFYLLLRKLNRAKYSEKNEFRRHVTMTTHIEGEEDMEIDIDTVSEYYKKTKAFIEYVKPLLGENE